MLGETETAVRGAVRTPLWPTLAVGAAALVAVGAAVWIFTQELYELELYVPAVTGYVVGCIIAVALASAHRALENRVRSNPGFRLQPVLGFVVTMFVVVGITAGLACAIRVAIELAKQS